MDIIIPGPLRPGDAVAILSPASTVKKEYIDRAARFLSDRGFRPVVMPHADGPADGSYAAPAPDRAADLMAAFRNPEIKAILCARGGYGSVELFPLLDPETVRENPKWLIGFSDISALHAYLVAAGVASLHAPMAKHLAEEDPEHYTIASLFRILEDDNGPEIEYFSPPHPLDSYGEASGTLVGGNLAVLNGLAATPYDIFALGRDADEPLILFIEDISEAIYAVERMLRRLLLTPDFSRIAGLIVGNFTDYRHPDRNFPDMETMIHTLLQRNGINNIPVCYGFPVGHTSDNLPLPEGLHATLSVAPEGSTLTLLSGSKKFFQ